MQCNFPENDLDAKKKCKTVSNLADSEQKSSKAGVSFWLNQVQLGTSDV